MLCSCCGGVVYESNLICIYIKEKVEGEQKTGVQKSLGRWVLYLPTLLQSPNHINENMDIRKESRKTQLPRGTPFKSLHPRPNNTRENGIKAKCTDYSTLLCELQPRQPFKPTIRTLHLFVLKQTSFSPTFLTH
jgi:hypothetical protein